MNGMKKAAKIVKVIGFTILAIVCGAAFIYFAAIEDASKAKASHVVFATADDYKEAFASLDINSNGAVAISDIATSSYVEKSFSRTNKVTSRTDAERVDEYENINTSNVPSVVASIEKEIQEEIASKGKVNLDEKVEKVIKILTEEGKTDVLSTYLGDDAKKKPDEKMQKDYLSAFIKASYSTKFPDLKRGASELDGIVKFKRGNGYLEYISYDELLALVNENNSDVEKYFSLKYENEKTKLILPNWSTDENGDKIYNLLNPIDYQTELNLFAMPFDFLWAMLVVSENKAFTYDLANLAINESSIIEISIIDTEISYAEGNDVPEVEQEANSETGTEVEIEQETEGNTGTDQETEDTDDLGTNLSKENSVNIVVTKADTWLLEYSMECSATIEEVEQENGEKIKNVVLNKGTPKIKEKLDEDSEQENFVTLFKKPQYANARKNVISASEWLYEILAESEDTVDMIDTVKYILYKATKNEKFAVADFNWADLAVFGLNTNASIYTYGSGLWWPIGSSSTEIINGKKFATGAPSTTNITSYFYSMEAGIRTKGHGAIDVAAGGDHYIIAAGDGTVYKAAGGYTKTGSLDNTDGGGWGNHVVIDHGNGLYTIYAHLKPNSVTVKVGEVVKQGQVIGLMGHTGRSTGKHLHFEVRSGSMAKANKVDPLEYVNPEAPRPVSLITESTLYKFLLKFEGGIGSSKYMTSDGDYKVFNNGVDDRLELSCGLTIGKLDSKTATSGEIWDDYKPYLSKDRYQIGDIVPKEEYYQCLEDFYKRLNSLIDKRCSKYGVTLTQAEHDAIFAIAYQASARADGLVKAAKNGKNALVDAISNIKTGNLRKEACRALVLNGDYGL